MQPSYNDAIDVLVDEVYINSMNSILESCEILEERLEAIDRTIDEELEEAIKIFKYHIENRKKTIVRSIKWRLADIHDDHRLIDDLIEDDIAEGERAADEYIRQLEEGN